MFMTVVVDRFVDVVASSGIIASFSLHSYFSCFIVSGLLARTGNSGLYCVWLCLALVAQLGFLWVASLLASICLACVNVPWWS